MPSYLLLLKPGLEEDAVFALMQKANALEQPFPILSAFCRDSLRGEIFVEVQSKDVILPAIRGILGVYPHRGLHLVPNEDAVRILTLRDLSETVLSETVSKGSWVRPKKGLYKGDIGFVRCFTSELVDVVLVPRVCMELPDPSSKGKRKRQLRDRPSRRLFNPAEIIKVFGPEAAVFGDGTYLFKNEIYKDGYLCSLFDHSDLTIEFNPTTDEIAPLVVSSEFSSVALEKLVAKNTAAGLSIGDNVEIISGEPQGLRGKLANVEMDTVQITLESSSNGSVHLIEIPRKDVRKYFEVGDYVKVKAGTEQGRSGWVVGCDRGSVTFYDTSTSAHVCLRNILAGRGNVTECPP